MQKVITITTHTNIIEKDNKFVENEYTELRTYLNDGYKVLQIVPITTGANNSYMYSLTFLLEKNN